MKDGCRRDGRRLPTVGQLARERSGVSLAEKDWPLKGAESAKSDTWIDGGIPDAEFNHEKHETHESRMRERSRWLPTVGQLARERSGVSLAEKDWPQKGTESAKTDTSIDGWIAYAEFNHEKARNTRKSDGGRDRRRRPTVGQLARERSGVWTAKHGGETALDLPGAVRFSSLSRTEAPVARACA